MDVAKEEILSGWASPDKVTDFGLGSVQLLVISASQVEESDIQVVMRFIRPEPADEPKGGGE